MAKRRRAVENIRNVFVVVKQSEYEQAVKREDRIYLALIGDANETTRYAMKAHEEHQHTMEVVLGHLKARKLKVTVATMGSLPESFDDYDLVVTVGGDGTFLAAAARCFNTPIVGVRSTPTSHGHHTITDCETFPGFLDGILAGDKKPYDLLRLGLDLEHVHLRRDKPVWRKVKVDPPILNEVLITNGNPAESSRYIITTGGKSERQDSSGIWIGPPPGSTAALRSAGGSFIPITDRKFEFVVREPIIRPGRDQLELLREVLDEHGRVEVVSRMKNGRIYIDSSFLNFRFNFGDRVTLRRHKYDLRAFIDPKINHRYSFFFGLFTHWGEPLPD